MKRERGQFFTRENPFFHSAFAEWAGKADLLTATVLEPFAGANSIIAHLQSMGLCRDFMSFDIEPAAEQVEQRDTLAHFPSGYSVCVTNPPWLARNSATVRNLPFPATRHDNLYKLALERCLENCDFVAALIPESFIRADLFQDRLSDFISIKAGLFSDTGHPTGLALFSERITADVNVWTGSKMVGFLSVLERMKPRKRSDGPVVEFNCPNGNLGLFALDDTKGPSIRFCYAADMRNYKVKKTGRHITKLATDADADVEKLNRYLNDFRRKTSDVLMTCYKGIRKDGMYRRRLDWDLARRIIQNA